MKIKLRYYKPLALVATGLIILFSACLKKTDEFPQKSPAIVFKGQNLVKTLGSQPSLHLFNMAFNRLGLAPSISNGSGYTIFALTDSVMKANGLDSTGINALNIDTLRDRISNQVGIGTFDDQQLTNVVTTMQIQTLRQIKTVYPSGSIGTQQALLYLKENGRLYFNGKAVNKAGPVLQSDNGYIYAVSGFVGGLPTRLLSDIIQNDPDLSMFNQAVAIADSVFIANVFFNYGDLPTLFSTVPPATPPTMFPTVIAPTNKAFYDAGFHNADDLRKFATRYPVVYDYNDGYTIHYSSLDSLLRHHILLNTVSPPYNIRVFYYDFLNPLINNGVYNTYVGGFTFPSQDGTPNVPALAFKTPLIFSNNNGIAYVKWSSDPKEPAVMIPLDASPQHPVNNYIGTNGQLYKIDKLFYPVVQ